MSHYKRNSNWAYGPRLSSSRASFTFNISQAALVAISLALIGCGGGDMDAGGNVDTAADAATSIPRASDSPFAFAQTHVMPLNGLKWAADGGVVLCPVADRDLLVLVSLDDRNLRSPVLEVRINGALVGSRTLLRPESLPPTEGSDVRFSAMHWSTTLPAAWVKPSLTLLVSDQGSLQTSEVKVSVLPKTDVTLYTLPFILFGASRDMNAVMSPSADERRQASAGMPFSSTTLAQHPLGEFVSSHLILPPTGTQEALRASSSDDLKNRKNPILDMTWKIHESSGDLVLNRVTFSGVSMLDALKKKSWVGGGVAFTGSGAAMGDPSAGLLWHEGGHAMSLGHSPEEWVSNPKKYIYPSGSLKGSAWGFDQSKGYFRSPFTAPTSWYASCSAPNKQERGGQRFETDGKGRCFRFDPMHSADEQKDPSATFPLFSDFNSGRILKWGLSRASLNAAGDIMMPDSEGVRSVYVPRSKSAGADGLYGGYPTIINKALDFVFITHSLAGTSGATQFYKPVRHMGNSIEHIDPMDSEMLKKITPYPIDGKWMEWDRYCKGSGCDFTVKATYKGGQSVHRVLRHSARKWQEPEIWKDAYQSPLSAESFLTWAVNIPVPVNGAKLEKLELLKTPSVWRMTPSQISSSEVVDVWSDASD
ncbi:Peptidase M66 [Comamonadaceae bacterium]